MPQVISAEDLQRAFNLWAELCGIHPDPEKIPRGTFGDWPEEVQLALKEDTTNFTALYLLEAYTIDYLRGTEVPMWTLFQYETGEVCEDDSVSKLGSQLSCVQGLFELFRAQRYLDYKEGLQASMEQAAEHYGGDRQEVLDSIRSPWLAYLRRDAFGSIYKLRVAQFLRGEPEPGDYQPQYLKHIYEFCNINSLLAKACKLPSGISMHLIRHDVDTRFSYFVFCVRNGGNLWLFTDAEEEAHPLQAQMRRSRSVKKSLDRRECQNWFPYQLLQVSDRYEPPPSKTLVPYQEEMVVLKSIKDLGPQEFLWTQMMFALIRDRAWDQKLQLPDLCYTGEMMVNNTTLLDQAEESGLVVVRDNAIVINPLTIPELKTGEVPEDSLGKMGVNLNTWMEERYASMVQAEEVETLPTVQGEKTLMVSPIRWGTEKQLKSDRLFLARRKYAERLHDLAIEEFEREKEEIIEWYGEALAKNFPALLKLIGEGECWRPLECEDELRESVSGSFGDFHAVTHRCMQDDLIEEYRILHLVERHKKKGRHYWTLGNPGDVRFGWRHRRDICVITGAAANWHAHFTPVWAPDLAFLTGEALEDLPEVLQHWHSSMHPHNGNPILQRIDPLCWKKYQNPWNRFDFTVSIYLSKRGLKRLQKGDIPSIPLQKVKEGRMLYFLMRSGHREHSKDRNRGWW